MVTISHTPITTVSNGRDLGVTFDRDLKFTDHIITNLYKKQIVYLVPPNVLSPVEMQIL